MNAIYEITIRLLLHALFIAWRNGTLKNCLERFIRALQKHAEKTKTDFDDIFIWELLAEISKIDSDRGPQD